MARGWGLSVGQRAAVTALAEALLPQGGPLELGAADVGVASQLDALVAGFDPPVRRLVRLMVTAFELSPILSRYVRPFSRLSPQDRETYLHACQDNRLRRELLLSLKTLCSMVYCADERVCRLIGYDGRPFKPVEEPLPSVRPLPCLSHPELNRDWDDEADVVIVGSGAGGATVAAELAEAGLSVIVVEEGGPVTREDFQDQPIARAARFYRDNGLTNTFGTPIISLPMGRVVGGTTVVNSGTCFRTPPFVLREWRETYGVLNMEPEQMAPLFERVEAALNVTPVTDEIMGHNGAMLRRGAEALEVSHSPIQRPVRACHGTGQCAFGCPLDAKLDMRLSYLPRAVAAGTRLYARCRVERILTERGRAVGVKAAVLDSRGREVGHTLAVRARAVVLAAGAVYTPWLLLRNRLGNRSGQVGRNLRIHPGSGVTALFDEEITGWQGVMQSYYVDQWLEEGFLLEATFPPPGMGYSAGALPFVGREHKALLARYGQMAALGTIVSDTGSGRIRRGLGERPIITYTLGREDTRRALAAIAAAARLYFAAGAREVYPGLPDLEVIRSVEGVEHITSSRWRAGDLKLSAYHPMGTCRMGEDPQHSVADSYGAVHDVPGLWIADASLMPSSTAVNPQITIMALATRVAQRILENGRGRME
ncbi:MAG: GMC family oxidoreductase N-terminal domain-containing protein, partial [Anaerolineae bacterium]